MSATTTTTETTAAPAATTTTAAAAPATEAATTVLSGGTEGASETTTTTPPATWPDDWRQKIAGDDAATVKRLERFASPQDMWKSYRAAEQKITSGEYRKAEPPADAKPEEIAAWRKDNGIPEKPTGYLDNLPNGLVIGDTEKKMVGAFVEDLHKLNAPPAYVHAALQSYYKLQETVQAERVEQDLGVKAKVEDELRAEWGSEFRANTNAIVGTVRAQFGEAADSLLLARLPDGTPLASNAQILRGLLAMAKDINPAATIVPATGGVPGASIDDRIGQIEGMMKDPKSGYYKNEKVQAEYRQLVDARERQKARAA